ncbi:MAG: DegT/DnrJ/EryC1/StrS family aminotransferase [Vicinamibacterales bacterium]
MRTGRTLPPTAAPVGATAIAAAVGAIFADAPVSTREEEIARYLGHAQAVLLSSGKAALAVVLEALKAGEGTRAVAIPAYTCYSVPAAVVRAGLEPVLVDVDPETFDFDPASLERAFARPDLLAVIPTHLFGIPANIDRVQALRGRRRIAIIEDAAQAFGVAAPGGGRLGARGDAAIFSLGRGKHLSAGGGGLIATRDLELAARVRSMVAGLPTPGLVRRARTALELAIVDLLVQPSVYWLPAGLPFLGIGETDYAPHFNPGGPVAPAVAALEGWSARLERSLAGRLAQSTRYITDCGFVPPGGAARPFLRFPVLLDSAGERTRVLAEARRLGLGVSGMYPTAIHQVPELRDRFREGAWPGADAIQARLVTLPTHAYVDDRDRRAIGALLRARGQSTPAATRSSRTAAVL